MYNINHVSQYYFSVYLKLFNNESLIKSYFSMIYGNKKITFLILRSDAGKFVRYTLE